MERPHYYTSGSRNGYEWVPCPCLRYDGPEPLPRLQDLMALPDPDTQREPPCPR